MKKTLYLMRHGQTLFNLEKRIQGWCDSPLTPLGIKQAQIARQHFLDLGITFDHAYSSTSERACDTLEIVTDHQMPYTRLKGLKELNYGTFEGKEEFAHPKLPFNDYFVVVTSRKGRVSRNCPDHHRNGQQAGHVPQGACE